MLVDVEEDELVVAWSVLDDVAASVLVAVEEEEGEELVEVASLVLVA